MGDHGILNLTCWVMDIEGSVDVLESSVRIDATSYDGAYKNFDFKIKEDEPPARYSPTWPFFQLPPLPQPPSPSPPSDHDQASVNSNRVREVVSLEIDGEDSRGIDMV